MNANCIRKRVQALLAERQKGQGRWLSRGVRDLPRLRRPRTVFDEVMVMAEESRFGDPATLLSELLRSFRRSRNSLKDVAGERREETGKGCHGNNFRFYLSRAAAFTV